MVAPDASVVSPVRPNLCDDFFRQDRRGKSGPTSPFFTDAAGFTVLCEFRAVRECSRRRGEDAGESPLRAETRQRRR